MYVAKNKHSNYNNASNCDSASGFWPALWSDDCSGNTVYLGSLKYEFNVSPGRNLGSSTYNFNFGSFVAINGCTQSQGTAWTSSPTSPRPVDPDRVECYWKDGARFGGWLSQSTSDGKGDPYRDALIYHGF